MNSHFYRCLNRRMLHAAPFVLAFLTTACGEAPPPVEKVPAAPVEVVKAHREALDEWTPFPGMTEALPSRQARVTAAVEGIVLSIAGTAGPEASVAPGQWVEKGQVIARLDDRIARDELVKAKADIQNLTAQVTDAANALQVARNTLGRYQDVLKKSSASTPLFSKADMESALAAVKSAEAKQQSLVAQQNGSKANVQTLESKLKYYTLQAPISGWLGTIQVVPGQTIAIGTSVADIIDLSDIDVSCFVPPSRIGRLALGQPARVVRSEGTATDREPEGKVVYVGRQAQSATGSFEVKVRFANKELNLAAGTVVQLLVRTTAPQERLVIPIDALMEDQDPPGVVIVPALHVEGEEKTGKVRVLQAKLGVFNRQRRLVEVLALDNSGSKEPMPPLQDIWFVVPAGNGLEDGDEVRVEEAHKEEK